ncbi:MAG: bifunctional phosphoribosylaminoimidazolecarboxamide formyltransferase/IMP cyclohydrolase, partial [Trebonia sp.]
MTSASETRIPIKRALLSVYDKAALAELAAALHAAGAELVSTGTTAKTIEQAGLPVTKVEDLTGFPECLGGRVKTLHPRVHAGLLADTGNPDHNTQLRDLGIEPFQLLVSNLYPFEQTVASGEAPAEIIEQIDIGGPAMVRAAAKNHGSVAVVTSPDQYADVIKALAAGGFTEPERRRLAAAAYAHTAAYDAAVASWFAASYAPDEVAAETGWPSLIAQVWTRADALRYGENPHQKAAIYKAGKREGAGGRSADGADPGIASAEVLHGKAMSYNNYVDADSARRAAYDFAQPCVAIIKHSNPCGIAIGANIAAAHAKALACDPLSAYGGVVAANSPVTDAMAQQITEGFAEVVIAPDFDPAAVQILTARWKNIRLLRCVAPPWAAPPWGATEGPGGTTVRSIPSTFDLRPVSGGLLAQTWDLIDAPGDDPGTWDLKAGAAADAATLADLAFAWRACRAVKSNAILLAADGASVGVGMGQVNRVDSARLAVARAGNRAAGSAAASDAFFPFPDGFEILAEAGVRAVAEPGGSIRDDGVIAAA